MSWTAEIKGNVVELRKEMYAILSQYKLEICCFVMGPAISEVWLRLRGIQCNVRLQYLEQSLIITMEGNRTEATSALLEAIQRAFLYKSV